MHTHPINVAAHYPKGKKMLGRARHSMAATGLARGRKSRKALPAPGRLVKSAIDETLRIKPLRPGFHLRTSRRTTAKRPNRRGTGQGIPPR